MHALPGLTPDEAAAARARGQVVVDMIAQIRRLVAQGVEMPEDEPLSRVVVELVFGLGEFERGIAIARTRRTIRRRPPR